MDSDSTAIKTTNIHSSLYFFHKAVMKYSACEKLFLCFCICHRPCIRGEPPPAVCGPWMEEWALTYTTPWAVSSSKNNQSLEFVSSSFKHTKTSIILQYILFMKLSMSSLCSKKIWFWLQCQNEQEIFHSWLFPLCLFSGVLNIAATWSRKYDEHKCCFTRAILFLGKKIRSRLLFLRSSSPFVLTAFALKFLKTEEINFDFW